MYCIVCIKCFQKNHRPEKNPEKTFVTRFHRERVAKELIRLKFVEFTNPLFVFNSYQFESPSLFKFTKQFRLEILFTHETVF